MMKLLTFAFVGFLAQLVDGALGMAYGVTSTTFLLSLGVSPAVASSSVHTAEVVTTGISGFSHWRLGNVSKELSFKLLLPGIIGGVLGAYILTSVPADIIKPLVSAYLLAMGLMILRRAIEGTKKDAKVTTSLIPLALIGGFFDAVGGGGWGPIVTSTLVARGHCPRKAIGSVNLVEFFVTTAEATTFFLTIGFQSWQVILGLMLGGALAAPAAAYACQKLPERVLMLIVGLLVTILSMRTIALMF